MLQSFDAAFFTDIRAVSLRLFHAIDKGLGRKKELQPFTPKTISNTREKSHTIISRQLITP